MVKKFVKSGDDEQCNLLTINLIKILKCLEMF